jgi:circadian clock protein KaiB
VDEVTGPAWIAEGGATKLRFVLQLYVTGSTARSLGAIGAVRSICEQHLAGRYDLQVIDIYQQPQLARDGQIIAVPTLVRQEPKPLRRIVGDMSDRARVLAGLGLAAAAA